jgi:hypothetical protein
MSTTQACRQTVAGTCGNRPAALRRSRNLARKISARAFSGRR